MKASPRHSSAYEGNIFSGSSTYGVFENRCRACGLDVELFRWSSRRGPQENPSRCKASPLRCQFCHHEPGTPCRQFVVAYEGPRPIFLRRVGGTTHFASLDRGGRAHRWKGAAGKTFCVPSRLGNGERVQPVSV